MEWNVCPIAVLLSNLEALECLGSKALLVKVEVLSETRFRRVGSVPKMHECAFGVEYSVRSLCYPLVIETFFFSTSRIHEKFFFPRS